MASKAVQMVCLTLGVIGLIGVITCCSLPRWRRTTFKGANAVTAQFQAVRAMTVISCILCGLSLLILLFGSDLTRCFKNQGTKAEIILVAAVGLLLAGLLVIIPVSWSAHTTIRDFYSPVFLKFHRREMGVCIYIGWAAGVLLILTGVLLCCFSRPRSSSSSRTVKYRRASGLNDDLI
ncbi:claudin-4-like isoform X2 [Gambusia affinis]|uniref:claudin-4-like isoform X2 n=1 Tax=Gambusia affinis TaxID=33528 RepID=UPI001CDD4510|nr:claudin-4-like isoform X2 [Gambusia affinis]